MSASTEPKEVQSITDTGQRSKVPENFWNTLEPEGWSLSHDGVHIQIQASRPERAVSKQAGNEILLARC